MLEQNKYPYFDDFDPKDSYNRILFKDGFPIQTRELNNLQSLFKHKLELFANHIFKNGSRVSGARFNTVTYDYVIIHDISPFDNKHLRSEMLSNGITIKSSMTKIPASIIKYDIIDNYHVLYIVYKGTSNDNENRKFIHGEEIEILDQNGNAMYSVRILDKTNNEKINVTGKGTLFFIEEGVFYFNGYFLENDNETLVISPFVPIEENKESFHVGFKLNEEIITVNEDESLYDLSLGYPNKSSPGADRYKITLKLEKILFDKKIDESSFIIVSTFVNGIRTYSKRQSEYSEIMDFITKRTYEESGNYTVKAPDFQFLEHQKKDENDPLGYDINGSKDNYVIKIGPSINYVLGYRVENTNDRFVIVPKTRSTRKISNFTQQFEEKAYIRLIPIIDVYPGSISDSKLYDGSKIILYGEKDNVQFDIERPNETGIEIGYIKIYDLKFEKKVKMKIRPNDTDNTEYPVYRYYIYDINLNQNKSISDIKAVFYENNSGTDFICKPFFDENSPIINNQNNANLIWKIRKEHIKSLRDIDNPFRGSITFVKRTKFKGILDNKSSITFHLKKGEVFWSPSINSTIVIVMKNGRQQVIDIHQNNVVTFNYNSLKIDLSSISNEDYKNHDICVITDVTVIKAIETKKKLATTLEIISIDPQNPRLLKLSKADAKKIIKVNAIPKNQQQSRDIRNYIKIPTDIFELHDGNTGSEYKNSYITLKDNSNYPDNVTFDEHDIMIEYAYYEHDKVNGIYTVDSYDGLISNKEITYDEIPVFISKNSKEKYRLADCLDFRPIVINDVILGDPSVPSQGEYVFFDIEYYLPRIDILQVKNTGEFNVKLGIPNDSPLPPEPDNNAMPLLEIWNEPYIYKLIDIRYKEINNRRYTMKDIKELDDRVKRLQYYTSLNLLEKSVADFDVKDIYGRNRYKNGFLIENFKDFKASNIESDEFRCSFDIEKGELRPSYNAKNLKLKFFPVNNNYSIKNDLLMLPYEHVMIQEQPYATKSLSINPYFKYTRKGSLKLTPNVDMWANVETLPEQTLKFDFGFETLKETARLMNMRKSGFMNKRTLPIYSSSLSKLISENDNTENFNISQNKNNKQTYDLIARNPRTLKKKEDIELGERVTDVKLSLWMRKIKINFEAKNLSPNTVVYPFFDDVPILKYCKKDEDSKFGEELKTDAEGNISGIFEVPEETFKTGIRKFVLSSHPQNINDSDTATYAEALFFAGDINIDKQKQILNVITPSFNFDERIVPSSPRKKVSPPPVDPVAQSFKLDKSCFITKIDLFFHSVDMTSDLIWVELRTMENGFPSNTVLARKEYTPNDIKISNNASIATQIVFDNPVYVKGNTEYCFVVGGSSPETRIWVAKIGDPLIDNISKIVETQPSLGSSFRSQNASTWNAEQFEDIKYRIYIAEFKNDTLEASFQIEHDTKRILSPIEKIETTMGSNLLKIKMKNHNVSVGDKIIFHLNPLKQFKINVWTETLPKIGEKIYAVEPMVWPLNITGIARVVDIIPVWKPNENREEGAYELIIDNVEKDWFEPGAPYCGEEGIEFYRTMNESPQFYGSIDREYDDPSSQDMPPTIIPIRPLNGLRVSTFFNTNHYKVESVDGINSFTVKLVTQGISPDGLPIQIPHFADRTGEIDNDIAFIETNSMFDIINVSGSYMKYDCEDQWTFKGIYNNRLNDPNLPQDNSISDDFTIKFNENFELPYPIKLRLPINEPENSQKNVIKFKAKSSNKYISPVLNLSSLNATLYTNLVSDYKSNYSTQGDFVEETNSNGGSELFKYITRKVSLSKPCTDLLILFDAYRDEIGNFNIYYRYISPGEQDIELKEWIEIPFKKMVNPTKEKIEYSLTLSELFENWSYNQISSFQIKIVGRTINTSNPPTFSNLRILALT